MLTSQRQTRMVPSMRCPAVRTSLRQWPVHLGWRRWHDVDQRQVRWRTICMLSPSSGSSGCSSSSSSAGPSGAAHCQLRGFASRSTEGGSGERTLANVVRELRLQGRLPVSSAEGTAGRFSQSASGSEGTSTGAAAATAGGEGEEAEAEAAQPSSSRRRSTANSVIDIDAELISAAAADEEVSSAEEEEELVEWDDAAEDSHEDAHDFEAEEGFLGEEAGHDVHRLAEEPLEGDADHLDAIDAEDHEPFEQIASLSEEELREKVKRSIEELVPQDMARGVGADQKSKADLTPAQLFYLENKEALIQRAQDYYLEKHKELSQTEDDGEDFEDEWRYYQDPVVRPQKGHLWSTGEEEDGAGDAREQDWQLTVQNWPVGEMPSPHMLADLLRREQAKDVQIVDLHACARHDVGSFGIVVTGITTAHCRRLGEIAVRAVQWCKVPYVDAFSYGTRNEDWVVAHCGSIKVHAFTREARQEYNLQTLWENPNEFFQPGDFPHYMDHFGSPLLEDNAEAAYLLESSGRRSPAHLPLPPREKLQQSLLEVDYNAAADVEGLMGSTPATSTGRARSSARGASGSADPAAADFPDGFAADTTSSEGNDTEHHPQR